MGGGEEAPPVKAAGRGSLACATLTHTKKRNGRTLLSPKNRNSKTNLRAAEQIQRKDAHPRLQIGLALLSDSKGSAGTGLVIELSAL